MYRTRAWYRYRYVCFLSCPESQWRRLLPRARPGPLGTVTPFIALVQCPAAHPASRPDRGSHITQCGARSPLALLPHLPDLLTPRPPPVPRSGQCRRRRSPAVLSSATDCTGYCKYLSVLYCCWSAPVQSSQPRCSTSRQCQLHCLHRGYHVPAEGRDPVKWDSDSDSDETDEEDLAV